MDVRKDVTQEDDFPTGTKKKYIKPAVSSENIFETKSMACGKCDAVGPSAYCFAGIETS